MLTSILCISILEVEQSKGGGEWISTDEESVRLLYLKKGNLFDSTKKTFFIFDFL